MAAVAPSLYIQARIGHARCPSATHPRGVTVHEASAACRACPSQHAHVSASPPQMLPSVLTCGCYHNHRRSSNSSAVVTAVTTAAAGTVTASVADVHTLAGCNAAAASVTSTAAVISITPHPAMHACQHRRHDLRSTAAPHHSLSAPQLVPMPPQPSTPPMPPMPPMPQLHLQPVVPPRPLVRARHLFRHSRHRRHMAPRHAQ